MLRSRLAFLFLTALVSACASNSKNFQTLNQSLGDPATLKGLCQKSVSGACALLGETREAKHSLPILQSVTSGSQSRFVIQVPKKSELSYYVRSSGGIERLQAERFSQDFSNTAVDHIEAFNLKVGESYELIVLGNDGSLWDQRSFRALDLSLKHPKLALVSCMSDEFPDIQAKIWPELLKQKPDAILMIGDNVYADRVMGQKRTADLEQLWSRHVDSRQMFQVFRANPLVPVFAVWDDHDYGLNDGDRTYPNKAQSTDVFFTFFHQRKPAPGFEPGLGVGSWWSAFGVQFAFLDDRSFRSPNKLDTPDQTHYGFDQEKWAKERLDRAKTPVFMISGDQFFGGYHRFESAEGSHPQNFKKLVQEWKSVKAPLIFLSGDRHLSEIIKVPKAVLGYPTFEVTSSGIHARIFADAFKRDPSPQQLSGADNVYNYSMLKLKATQPRRLDVDVEAFTLDQKQLYKNSLTVKR